MSKAVRNKVKARDALIIRDKAWRLKAPQLVHREQIGVNGARIQLPIYKFRDGDIERCAVEEAQKILADGKGK